MSRLRLRFGREGFWRWYQFSGGKGRGVWCGPFESVDDARWMVGWAVAV